MIWLVLLPAAALSVHTVVNAFLLRRPAVSSPAEPVSVLLPVRDEAGRVADCLQGLLAQEGDVEILVLDDGSTDGTVSVVSAVAGERVRLLTGAPLTESWLGKPHACEQLAAAARPASRVLVFVDADVVLEPGALSACVTLLRSSGVDLLSPYPRITGAGRIVQPLLQWSWLTFLPLRAMELSPHPSLAAAGGQLLVLDRAAYLRAGGHGAVRGSVLEDIELARAVKRSGGRIAIADASRFATCRMYETWGEVVDGYTKSLWASFGSPAGAASVVTLMLLVYALPPVLALGGTVELAAVGGCAYLIGVFGRVVTAAVTGGRRLDAVAHPVSVVVFAWLVARSFRRRRTVTWRGRPVLP